MQFAMHEIRRPSLSDFFLLRMHIYVIEIAFVIIVSSDRYYKFIELYK